MAEDHAANAKLVIMNNIMQTIVPDKAIFLVFCINILSEIQLLMKGIIISKT